MSKYSLNIGYLYSKEMNIYGDNGNIITLKRRMEWRDIDVDVIYYQMGKLAEDSPKSDLYFMGGGQDNDMYAVFEDLVKNKKEFIKSEVKNKKPFLLICGAFELFGKYFLDASGRKIDGLGILPIETKAPGDALTDRCLGNIVYKIDKDISKQISETYSSKFENTIVGFENHSGQVVFTDPKNIKPIGEVIHGKGNNSTDGVEGGSFNNIYGSFTHGSLLPKNPHFADFLISLALETKYNEKIKLEPLDDEVEWKAHKAIRNKIMN